MPSHTPVAPARRTNWLFCLLLVGEESVLLAVNICFSGFRPVFADDDDLTADVVPEAFPRYGKWRG